MEDKRTATWPVHLFALVKGVGGVKRKKEKEIVISGYGYLWTRNSERRKKKQTKGEKMRGEKGELFTLSGYRWSRPASLFYQEKMLIINLRLHATSLFNS